MRLKAVRYRLATRFAPSGSGRLVEPAFTRTGRDHKARDPDGRLADHDKSRAAASRMRRTVIAAGAAPALVGNGGVRAVIAARPMRRDRASGAARNVQLMRRFVPQGACDKSLCKQIRLTVRGGRREAFTMMAQAIGSGAGYLPVRRWRWRHKVMAA